jgi:hypothetical protein
MSTLRGKLQSISLIDVLQLLHANRKTGELLVTRGSANGVLYVVAGEVVHAETAKAQGESAAFDILGWDQGSFEFVTTAVKAAPSIRRSVPDLLMESARTADARRHLSGIFPDLNLVPWPRLKEPELTRDLRLFAEDRPCLPFLDGFRTFREAIDDSGLSDVSVLQACATLQGAGRLELLRPTLELAAAENRAGLFRQAGQAKLAAAHEERWRAAGPAAAAPIVRVRLQWGRRTATVPARFVKDQDAQTIGVPPELMQLWELPERTMIGIRPAP